LTITYDGFAIEAVDDGDAGGRVRLVETAGLLQRASDSPWAGSCVVPG
jgi:hypothetical protein